MEFYTELKKARREKEIDLGEVANRTKINQEYLDSIEKGDFTFLPHVYVRLFLKAYAVEIGVDPDEALNQLEIYLEKEQISPPEQLTIEDSITEEHMEDYQEPTKSPLQSRTDLIKVIILVAVFIFAIFIIKQITSENEPAAVSPPETQSLPEEQLSESKVSGTDEPQVVDEVPVESEDNLATESKTPTPASTE